MSRVFSVHVTIFKMATTFDQELRKVCTTLHDTYVPILRFLYSLNASYLLFKVIIKLTFMVCSVFVYSSAKLDGKKLCSYANCFNS